jgi:hypothetical protein
VKSKIEKKNIESQTWGSGRWAFFKKFDHSNHAPIFQFIRSKEKKSLTIRLTDLVILPYWVVIWWMASPLEWTPEVTWIEICYAFPSFFSKKSYHFILSPLSWECK